MRISDFNVGDTVWWSKDFTKQNLLGVDEPAKKWRMMVVNVMNMRLLCGHVIVMMSLLGSRISSLPMQNSEEPKRR